MTDTTIVESLEESFHEVNESENPVPPEHMCHFCGKMYLTKPGLTRHVALKHDESSTSTMLSCNICDAKFTTRGHLIGHINSHNNIRPFECKKCKTRYAYKSSLLRHGIHCTGRKSSQRREVFKCDQCFMEFTRKDTLTEHTSGKHDQELKYACKDCNKHFKWRSSLVNHLKSKGHSKQLRNN